MNAIYKQIEAGTNLRNSLETYRAVLLRVRETYFNKNLNSLKKFIQLWLIS